MSWVEIFKTDNSYNEKTILGACSFAIMVLVMLADIITGWMGKDLVVNEFVYNSFLVCNAWELSASQGLKNSLIENEQDYRSR
jgi:hypothetical protein